MRYIENNNTDPYFNLALEEFFFKNGLKDEIYFWLWQNDNTIVIGKNQNPYNEINMAFVKENDVTVSRRMTGGGAVYHDLGNVNFSFIAEDNGAGYDFSRFTKPIIKALADLGAQAKNIGRNDIEINGKKISGNAQFVSNGRILHHGTLLFNSNLTFVDNCLTVSSDKLSSHGVPSSRSRVSNIKDFITQDLTVLEFINHIKHCILNEYEVDEKGLSESELAEVNKLRESKYATDEWIYGASSAYVFSLKKRFEGCGSIHICADVNDGRFADFRIFGDFFGSGDVADIERKLNGCLHNIENIRAALSGIDITEYIRGLTFDEFIEIFE